MPRFRFINNLSISIRTNLFKLGYPDDDISVNKVIAWVGKDILLTGAFQVIRVERFHREHLLGAYKIVFNPHIREDLLNASVVRLELVQY